MAAFDKKQMDAIVNRFLGWKLPDTFGPDCYVSFDKAKAQANHGWPIGTNLLTANEARAMLEYVLDVTFIPDWSLLEAAQASLREHMALARGLRDALAAIAGMDPAGQRADDLGRAARAARDALDALGVAPSDGGERARFEAAMRVKHPEWAFTADPVFDYHNERTRCAWEGWQAALAAGVLGTPLAADSDPEKRPDFYTWTWDVEIGGGRWEARYGWKKPVGAVHNLKPLFTHGAGGKSNG